MFGRSLNEIKDYTNTENEPVTVNCINIDDWKEHMEKIQSLIYPAILERTISKKDNMIKH